MLFKCVLGSLGVLIQNSNSWVSSRSVEEERPWNPIKSMYTQVFVTLVYSRVEKNLALLEVPRNGPVRAQWRFVLWKRNWAGLQKAYLLICN